MARQAPGRIVYEDEWVVAFHDIAPQAPIHLLVVPRRPIPRLGASEDGDRELLGHLLLKVAEVARRVGLDVGGYRVVINHGHDGGESVPHLHLHVLGGRRMRWPPG
jgi:histidine triad (HIT) family protein